MKRTFDRSDFRFRGGKVTQAFDDWRLQDGYLRAFVRLGLEFADEGYQRRLDEIANQPSDGEGPGMFDLMDRAVDNLIPQDYLQMHLSGSLRDGVTVFELYLEKALAEIVEWQLSVQVTLPEGSPYWPEMRTAWKLLTGIDLAGRPVEPHLWPRVAG